MRRLEGLRQWAIALLAMSGIFVTRLTPLRVATTGVVLAASALLAWSGFQPGLEASLWWFGAGYLVRYAFLFGSFGERGLAAWLKRRWGLRTGFDVYESLTALQFFGRALTFSWLLEASRHPASSLGGLQGGAVVAAGLSLAAAGMAVNLWATRVVGLSTYFYGDLFLGDDGPAPVLVAAGPYRYLENPMYGLGQLGGYGIALAAFSPACLAATLFNQATMYLFNWLVEQPHLRRWRERAVGGVVRPS
jgi:protein-S-isoprenylcysteine O-methyltransferase Ste14